MKTRQELDHYYCAIGGFQGGQVNTGIFFVTMKAREDRPLYKGHRETQADFMNLVRTEFSKIPGLDRVSILDMSQAGFSAQRGYPIQFMIQGPEWGKLAEYGAEFRKRTLFDSNSAAARPLFALADLAPLLLPGETLTIRRKGVDVAVFSGSDSGRPSSWLQALIRRLPVDGYDRPLLAEDSIATPLGSYQLRLSGDVAGLDRSLGAVAARMSVFVGAMLMAIALTWAAIELRMIRRITVLTKRAASWGRDVKEGAGPLRPLDLQDLRGSDELGLLAGVLAELMQRVNEDLRREQLRAAQEQEQWHAVGHEIMSPLQSLMVLHPAADDASHRYIQRMQQAVRVLYGSASPSEAFAGTSLALQSLDVDEFLRHVAANAVHAGIADVRFDSAGEPVPVRADAYALEDAVTHVLANAQRLRTAGTPITLSLLLGASLASIRIHNSGPQITAERLQRIFEYGESDSAEGAHRGQGLFVARTYLAKMGGTIEAVNGDEGVTFVLGLQRA